MDRANIFQESITSHSHPEIVQFVQGFNHSLVEIKPNQIVIKKDNDITHKYVLTFLEEDNFTITYKGKFENGTPFRLIQPTGIALENIKSKYKSKGGFTIGSLDPDGFGIHFLLTEPSDIRSNIISSKGNTEQIQRLIEGALMSLQFHLQEKFFDITKRIISMIQSNPSMLRSFTRGDIVIKIMKDNIEAYDSKEQGIIKQI